MLLESEKLTPLGMMYVRESSCGRAIYPTSEYSRNIKKLMEEFVAQRVQIVDVENGLCKVCGSGCLSPGVIDDGFTIEGFENGTFE